MGFMDRIGGAGRALLGDDRSPAEALAAGITLEPKASFGDVQRMSEEGGWIIRALGGGKTDAGIGVSEWTAITLPAVYACVSIISNAKAQLPVAVYRKLPDGKGREEVAGHPVAELLNHSPNGEISSFVFRQTVQHHSLLWGNGYAEIERTRGGDPVALWPLFPDRTRPDKPAGGSLTYRTSVNGQQITLPPDDVLHIPALGFDGFIGYSPIAVARNAVGLGLAAEKFGGKFFANDARSGGFLQHPGKLGDKGTKNVAESFNDQGGADNAFKIKVLEEGMKFISTTIPPDDAQFLATRDFQVAEIARLYGVPLVLLQAMEKSTTWGTGIEQIMIGFVQWTIQPWLVRWEQELNRKLLTPAERAAGYYIKFNLNALLRGDMQSRAAFYTSLFQVAAISPNEIRAYEDLNPYDGGDTYRVPLNTGDATAEPGDPNAAGESGQPPPPDPQKD